MINLKEIAAEKYYRLTIDESFREEPRSERVWYYQIPCKYGFISVWSKELLAAYCNGVKTMKRLELLGKVVQKGDKELRITFPLDKLDEVATLLQVRKRRVLTEEQKRILLEKGVRFQKRK